jgi:hypothetical protein
MDRASRTEVFPVPFSPTTRLKCGWNVRSRRAKPLKFSTRRLSIRTDPSLGGDADDPVAGHDRREEREILVD